MNSPSLCSLAGWCDNPIPTQFLAPIDCLKIPALHSMVLFLHSPIFQYFTNIFPYYIFIVIRYSPPPPCHAHSYKSTILSQKNTKTYNHPFFRSLIYKPRNLAAITVTFVRNYLVMEGRIRIYRRGKMAKNR